MLVFWIFLAVSVNYSHGYMNRITEMMEIETKRYLSHIIPSMFDPEKDMQPTNWDPTHIFNESDPHYLILKKHLHKGTIRKGTTFSIYDHDIREATLAIYHMILKLNPELLYMFKNWIFININYEVFEYAYQMYLLYTKIDEEKIQPRFIRKPNYFVNSETIIKALKIKSSYGKAHVQDGSVNRYFRKDGDIVIYTNYSEWDQNNVGCNKELNYFREDVGLNSYYYGIHQLHPFWMSNQRLSNLYKRDPEYYFFRHKQLLTRYMLEQEHVGNIPNKDRIEKCNHDYNPYLIYNNGLHFPTRSADKTNEVSEFLQEVTKKHLALKEQFSRGIILASNGKEFKPLSVDNHTLAMTMLIRKEFDFDVIASDLRSLYAYSNQIKDKKDISVYRPAPSVMHHTETTLRDPAYWNLIDYALTYFKEVRQSFNTTDLSTYEEKGIKLRSEKLDNLTTYFKDYEFSISQTLFDYVFLPQISVGYTANQRRLTYRPFNFTFIVTSDRNRKVAVRLFLGPNMTASELPEKYFRFFQLDSYETELTEGPNIVVWSPENSNTFSDDIGYDVNYNEFERSKFSQYKFPLNLLIPHGTKNGLNVTLFVTFNEILGHGTGAVIKTKHSNFSTPIDSRSLEFPFDRPVSTQSFSGGSNYKFYTIPIYHKQSSRSVFSKHLW